MLKKLVLATAAVGLLMSTASAEYYIVQEKATKKCKVVETRPTETTWIQIGPAAFKTQADAQKQIKTVCVETLVISYEFHRGAADVTNIGRGSFRMDLKRSTTCPLWVKSRHMSALPPKADICSATAHVR